MVEYISPHKADSTYFAEHPEEKWYIREPLDGEWGSFLLSDHVIHVAAVDAAVASRVASRAAARAAWAAARAAQNDRLMRAILGEEEN